MASQGFDELVTEYLPTCMGYCSRRVRREVWNSYRDDFRQVILIAIWRTSDKPSANKAQRARLFMQAAAFGVAEFVRNMKLKRIYHNAFELSHFDRVSDRFETTIEQRELAEIYLNTLQPELRQIFHEHYYNGREFQDIAQALGTSKKALSKRVCKAIKTMQAVQLN